MNEQNEPPAEPPRRPTNPGSVFLTIMLIFMLFGGNDNQQHATHDEILDSLQALKYDHGNFSAWVDGSPSNFTLEYPGETKSRLIGAFKPPKDPFQSGYYQNITGTYKSKDIVFHNLTTPLESDSWATLAHSLYLHRNTTTIHARSQAWNWTAPLQASVSIFSYQPNYSFDNNPMFYRFRGSIEFELLGMSRGFVTGPDLVLQIEGIHQPQDGSLVGLVESKYVMPDIRQLVSMTSGSQVNTTAKVVAKELSEKIHKIESRILDGTMEIDTPSEGEPECSFALFGQMEGLSVPQHLVDEFEMEMEHPSGVPVAKLSPPTARLVLFSENCGVLLEMNELSGTKSRRFYQRVIIYSAISAVIYYALIQLSLQVSDQWRTATNLLRGSRGVVTTWLIADSYAAISHIMAAVFSTEARTALLVPSFLSCVLLLIELRLMTNVNGMQFLAAQTQNPPTTTTEEPPLPTIAHVLLAGGAQTSNIANPASSSIPSETPQPINLSETSRNIVIFFFKTDFRAWISTICCVSLFCAWKFGLPLHGVWFLLVSSTWLAQITRNAFQRTRRVVSRKTVFWSSVIRLFNPLYLFACPHNLLDVEPAPWVWILPVWVALQVAVLFGQDQFGPTWFIPTRWTTTSTHDYHPILEKYDEETSKPTLGDCSICMEMIPADSTDPYLTVPENEKWSLWFWRRFAKPRRVYAVAPCGHNFHTVCLEHWMDIKNICPSCRGPLPPL